MVSQPNTTAVLGTLDAPDHALYISHTHPDGQVHFNVYTAPRSGTPWGAFSEDTGLAPDVAAGPHYSEASAATTIAANKVSDTARGTQWDTVLVARLRFKPDVLEPTSL